MREIEERGITVVRAAERHRDDLEVLVAGIEAEDHPDDARAASRAPRGMARSLSHYDALSSDSAWFLLAYRGERPAGLAILTRIPKLDERVGFLYLDELHVLAEHRRHGIGRALIGSAVDLTRELGLAGIRILTRPDNRAARALYESLGFHCSQSLLYQVRVERHDLSF
jgi:ribosomal protein S18 acetylase RimI-like enzyme